MHVNFDSQLLQLTTPELLKKEFFLYKKIKTDDLFGSRKVKIQVGVDGVNYKVFEKNIKAETMHISKRIREGAYFFKPFREVEIPKNQQEHSKSPRSKEVRTISIACIRDVLMQRVMYKTVYIKAEFLFDKISNVSFGYRKGKSAPQAAQLLHKYIKQGYTDILDADIKSFFDSIPHHKLLTTIEESIGQDNHLLLTYFKRFISVDRVIIADYNGDFKHFHQNKPIRTKRERGIPQGGVLSGLIANLYLHPFDLWVVNSLSQKYDLKYIRYADDFVVLTKKMKDTLKIKDLINEKLKQMGLILHTSEEKTKRIDLREKGSYVNFVGFSVSPSAIRIRQSNINNFKQKLSKIINETKLFEREKELNPVISKFSYKLLGNEALELRRCQKCSLYESKRSWFHYFSIVTDVRQLRLLDTWIRKSLYQKYYRDTGKRLKASELSAYKLVSMEELYYKSKKEIRLKYCNCSPLDRQLERRVLIEQLFKHDS